MKPLPETRSASHQDFAVLGGMLQGVFYRILAEVAKNGLGFPILVELTDADGDVLKYTMAYNSATDNVDVAPDQNVDAIAVYPVTCVLMDMMKKSARFAINEPEKIQ